MTAAASLALAGYVGMGIDISGRPRLEPRCDVMWGEPVNMGERSEGTFWDVLSEDARRGLHEWLDAQPYTVEPIEWFDGGMSSSQVAVVARLGSGVDDKVAIKFARTGEVNRWQAAVNDCPEEFRKQHIVDISTLSRLTSGENSWWITVLQIAGGDLSLFRPLARLQQNKGLRFARTCRNIVSSLIEDWNPTPRRHSPECLPRAVCMSEVFDTSRVVAGKPLWTFLESIDVTLDDPLIPGLEPVVQLPNPLAFAANADRLDDGGQRGIQYGRAHGDMHLRNILVDTRARPKPFKLIDLGGYSAKSPLARDPMHLLLSIAVDWLNSGITPGSQNSRSLIDVIVRPHEGTTEKEYREVSQAIHGAGHDWASKLNWGEEWTQQSLLFLAGCALRYASREIPGVADAYATQRWLFEVAAVAARAYLEEIGLWDRYWVECANRHSGAPLPTAPLASPPASALPPPPASAVPSAAASAVAPAPPPASSSRSADTASEQADDGTSDAQILPFRQSSKRQARASRALGSGAKGTWQDLVKSLREVTFDATDWYTLAAYTDSLLQEISRRRPPHPIAEEEIADHLLSLKATLTDVLKQSASRAELRSACTRAELLRGWLLDLLTPPRR